MIRSLSNEMRLGFFGAQPGDGITAVIKLIRKRFPQVIEIRFDSAVHEIATRIQEYYIGRLYKLSSLIIYISRITDLNYETVERWCRQQLHRKCVYQYVPFVEVLNAAFVGKVISKPPDALLAFIKETLSKLDGDIWLRAVGNRIEHAGPNAIICVPDMFQADQMRFLKENDFTLVRVARTSNQKPPPPCKFKFLIKNGGTAEDLEYAVKQMIDCLLLAAKQNQ